DVIFSPDLRLRRIYVEDNRLVAVLRNEYSLREEERVVDQIVAEHGTLPNEALYFALKPHSTNLGELDHRATPPPPPTHPKPPSTTLREGFSSSASAMLSPAATSTRRSTTRCGCARTCS